MHVLFLQAEQAGTTINLSVPQVQLINPENQIVEASSSLRAVVASHLTSSTSFPLTLATLGFYLALFPSLSAGQRREFGQ